jgi:hypothetical protein
MRLTPSASNGPESLRKLVETLNEFAAADLNALESLQEALYRSDQPLSEEHRLRIIKATAEDIAKHTASAEYLITQSNRYWTIRNTMLAKWGELPFATRMMLREMLIATDRTNHLYNQITDQDREDLLRNFPDNSSRENFVFAMRERWIMSNDIRGLVKGDNEVANATTSFEVWNEVKQADPRMEDELFKPLDPSKYVKRDMERTPRRSA